MRKSKEIEENPEQRRNVRRTKTALRNSLLGLMKTQSILNISVKEICDAADVGRSTFYAHYESHYKLLEEIETECLAVFEKQINQPLCKFDTKEFTQWFEKTIQFMADNSNSIQTLLSENGDISFQRKFIQCFVNNLENTKKKYADKPINNKISECYSVFIVHGTLALIQHWLKNNMFITVPEFAKMFVSIIRDNKL